MLRLDGSSGELHGLEFAHEPERSIDAVFLHANGFCASTYRSMLSLLAPKHRVVAFDQRGHGRSTLPADPQGRGDWLDMRDDLLAALEALGVGPVVVSGHSLGATVALLAAEVAPERFKALVLFDPVLLHPELVEMRHLWKPGDPWPELPLVQGALRRRATFESRAAAQRALTGRGAFKTWPAGALADYCLDGFIDEPNGGVRLACAPTWEASTYCAQGHDAWGALGRVRCPVTLVRAAEGSTCHEETARAVARQRPSISVTVAPGTTHFIPQERPELAAELLEAVLERRS